jgi:uncharacterized repeat protein (TIGR03803 family)
MKFQLLKRCFFSQATNETKGLCMGTLSLRRRQGAGLQLEQLETRLMPSSLITLGSFHGANGSFPVAGLLMDHSGNLYGTTSRGGPGFSAVGTVFELDKGSGTIFTRAPFDENGNGFAPNGRMPASTLIMDSDGNLYGTAYQGGTLNDGTVFEVAKGSGTITPLASFDGSNTGSYPEGTLVMDATGNLYGTTDGGGASNDGTVFEWVKGNGTIKTLASFNGANGMHPGDIWTSPRLVDTQLRV